MRTCFFCCFLLLLATTENLAALPPKEPALSPDKINQLAADLKLDPNGPQMRRLLREQSTKVLEPRLADTMEDKPVVLIKRYRGTNGVALPKREDVKPIFEISPEQEEAMRQAYRDEDAERLRQAKVVPDLPECRESVTTKTATGYKETKADKRKRKDEIKIAKKEGSLVTDVTPAHFDMLFIRKEKLPREPDEAFGKFTVIMAGSPDGEEGVLMAAVGVGVKCLPTRFRATNRFLYRDEGRAALLNYDKDPDGAGEAHEYVASFGRAE